MRIVPCEKPEPVINNVKIEVVSILLIKDFIRENIAELNFFIPEIN